MEGVENTGDNAQIGAGGDVGLKTDITKLRLRGNVNGHIFTKPIVILLLDNNTSILII